MEQNWRNNGTKTKQMHSAVRISTYTLKEANKITKWKILFKCLTPCTVWHNCMGKLCAFNCKTGAGCIQYATMINACTAKSNAHVNITLLYCRTRALLRYVTWNPRIQRKSGVMFVYAYNEHIHVPGEKPRCQQHGVHGATAAAAAAAAVRKMSACQHQHPHIAAMTSAAAHAFSSVSLPFPLSLSLSPSTATRNRRRRLCIRLTLCLGRRSLSACLCLCVCVCVSQQNLKVECDASKHQLIFIAHNGWRSPPAFRPH